MNKKLGVLAVALTAAFLAGSMHTPAGAKPQPVSEQAKSLADADNKFGLKLFKQLHKDGENTFISPASIAICMQMAGQAAAGDTRSEMDKVMELGSLDTKAANKDLIAELSSRDGVKLNIANSLWADPARVSLNDAYVKEVQEFFDSAAMAAYFSDPKTLKLINDWIAGKTNNLITDMLDEIPDVAIAYLINAIYFKGDWSEKFDKRKTAEADFHLADGKTSRVKLMSRHDDIVYGQDTKAQWVKLPYGKDEKAAMWVVLPTEGNSLDDVVKNLDDATLKAWRDKAWEREGTVKLPRFTMRYKKTLNEPLKALGIVKAFDAEQADFKRLGETRYNKIFINRVLHEAVVIVNEEGTEAAAATVVEMGCGGGAPPKPFSMVCDRPFLFMITDEPTGAILFMGTCYQPENPKD